MSTAAVDVLVADLEAAAKAAQDAEEALRRRMSEEVARAERHRVFAFRRARLVRTLAVAASRAGSDAQETDVAAAQRRAVRDELGWSSESAAYTAILDRLQPVGLAVWQCVCAGVDGAPANVSAELEAFEAWFEAGHDKSFYALFDQYYPEVPVVDF